MTFIDIGNRSNLIYKENRFILNWLFDNIGSCPETWRIIYTNGMGSGPMQIVFKNAEDAILFKLWYKG